MLIAVLYLRCRLRSRLVLTPFVSFDNDGEAFGRALVRFSYLIVFCHKMQDPVKSLSEEFVVHALGAAAQIELHFDAVAIFQPC